MEVSEQSTELDVTGRLHEVIDDGRRRIAAIVEPACPTVTFLTALADELDRAGLDPGLVPFPELADADRYWEAAVKPQSNSVRNASLEAVSNLEARIAQLLEEAEREMATRVDAAVTVNGTDPADARTEAIDDVAAQCQHLHHLLAELLTVLPSSEPLQAAEAALDDARRDQATCDVESLKAAYLREAGGDNAHQMFAEQQWSETFGARIAHRETMLRSDSPWRHQELAIVGHVRSRDAIEAALDEAVERLQSPLIEIGERLVRRYDSAAAGS